MDAHDLAEAAAAARPLTQVAALTRWVGKGRRLTQTNRITMADARALVGLLETGDVIDPVIGNQVYRTRSSDNLRGLTIVRRWAMAAGLVRIVGGRLVPVKKHAALLERPVDLWIRMFGAYDQIGEAVCPDGWTQSLVRQDFAKGVDTILSAMIDRGGMIALGEASDLVWTTLSARYQLDGASQTQLETWRRLADRDVRLTIELLAELGAVTIGAPSPGPAGTDGPQTIKAKTKTRSKTPAKGQASAQTSQPQTSSVQTSQPQTSEQQTTGQHSADDQDRERAQAELRGQMMRLTPLAEQALRVRSGAPAPGDTLLQVKITLLDTRPAVWRRVLLPATISLDRLHTVIQAAMGWADYHMHVFTHATGEYGRPDPELHHQDERKVTLGKLGAAEGERIGYTYDFGDSWEHEIIVEKLLVAEPGNAYPICVAGARACPPEDCGGAPGYEELVEALAKPAHPAHEDMLEWLGLDKGTDFDPARFDLEETNVRLANATRTKRRG